MTGDIRWEQSADGGFAGHVGTLEAFRISPSGEGERWTWTMTSALPGQSANGGYAMDSGRLKILAGEWLAGYWSARPYVAAALAELRADITRERDTYCGIAAQREREGRELQAERLHKYVDGLDRALALMDRMTPETTAPVPGKENSNA